MEAFMTEAKVAQAEKHRDAGLKLLSAQDFEAASAEFTKGIELLLHSSRSTSEVLNVIVQLRDLRGTADAGLLSMKNGDGGEQRCRQMVQDSTAVLDMPKHATPKQQRSARVHRAQAIDVLINSLQVSADDQSRNMALHDIQAILADEEATESEKNIVEKLQLSLNSKASTTTTSGSSTSCRSDSIHGSFLTLDDLSGIQGLNMGVAGQPRHFVAKSFMDKAGPVSMSDGTPKRLPPGVSNINQISHMSAAHMNRAHGMGAGTFFGEQVYWHNHGGRLLGKHKWEAEGDLENDKATVGEFWDMRWVFGTAQQARAFHQNMLEASRLEGGNGYLDKCPELSLKSGERSSLNEAVVDLIMYGSHPKRKPQGATGFAVMAADPTVYLQQYGAVFCVGPVVVKLFAIEGFNAQFGPLKRSAMIPLVNTVTKTIQEWLDGTRREWKNDSSANPQALGVCAHCGKKDDDLKRCSRCHMVAYCDRECQRGHYSVHKKPCKLMAASKAG